tara:strand:- start:935 stop:2176 length:1242 start_codon:yes stop_codon:yes gene_type:complete
MQANGLKNILQASTAPNGNAAAATPDEGLLGALTGSFEGILSDIESTVAQTAEGMGEALSELPEFLADKITDLLSAVGDLAEGTPLGDFLGQMGLDPKSLGLTKTEANQYVFDGDDFANAQSKTFDLESALETFQSRLESVTKLVKKGVEGDLESLRLFSDDLKGASKIHNKEMTRPSFFEAGDDFLASRELAMAAKSAAGATYAKQEGSLFSKYAAETEAATADGEAVTHQQIVAEAITGTTKSSGDSSTKMPAGTLDLSSMGNTKSSEVITKIVNYLDQQQLTSKGQLDVLVKHDELGQFRLNVSRGVDRNAIEMKIMAGGEGHRFFTEHEVDLVKALNQSGVKLTDLKILQSDNIAESGKSSSGSFSDSQGDEATSQFGHSKNQQQNGRDGSDRRKLLWEEYRERMGASA